MRVIVHCDLVNKSVTSIELQLKCWLHYTVQVFLIICPPLYVNDAWQKCASIDIEPDQNNSNIVRV